jgi:predicted ester cyclase
VRRLWLLLFIGTAAVMYSGGFQSMRAAPSEQTAAQTSQEEYKGLVRRWIEQGFNNKDLTVVDELFVPQVIVNGQRVGRLGLKQSMTRFIKAFPNLRVTITEVVAEGDKVGIWYTVQGTQTGEFEGIRATGNQVRWFGADLFRIEKGKIVECRFVDDSLGLLRQLGAILSPPH